MNERFNNNDWRDQAAAYVAGALPQLEQQAFRAQLMRDSELAEYVAGLQRASDELPYGVVQIDSPKSLKRSIIDAAAADLAVQRRVGVKRRIGHLSLRPAFAIAITALVLIGMFYAGRITVSDKPMLDPSSAIAVVPTTPATGGDPQRTTVSGKVMMLGDGDEGAMVELEGLDPSAGSQIYQLWLKRGDRVVPSSIFDAKRNGDAVTMINADMRGVDAVMITVEPAGGSEQPTGDVFAKATFQ